MADDPRDLSMVAATQDAIDAARAAGVITDMDDGVALALLRMADRMDDPDFPFIEGRYDNVTEALFVKTARELGLTVAGRTALPEKKEAKGAKLSVLRADLAGRTG